MRAFMLVREVETEIEGVANFATKVEFVDAFTYRSKLPEILQFFAHASTGDVFQVQDNEYIVALGELTKASWLR